MLLNAVILVLREVIEASLLISLFLAFCQFSGRPKRLLLPALIIGAFFATLYASNLHTVSQWLDGVGQEITNAGICLLIYLFLTIFVVSASLTEPQKNRWIPSATIIASVIFTTIQEGSEIILYIHGFSASAELFRPVLFGSLIGTGIGVSFGIFIYYLLVNIPSKSGLKLGFAMILLITGSLALQVTQLLAQADWIPSQYPLWNSSSLINEHSLPGQLLYALIGYEATPTPIQIAAYLASLLLISGLLAYSYFSHKEQPDA